MIPKIGLAVALAGILCSGADAGVRSTAVRRSVGGSGDREALVRGATYAAEALQALRRRSVMSALISAGILTRSEYDPAILARFQAEYTPPELRLLAGRSEYSAAVHQRIQAASDPPESWVSPGRSDPGALEQSVSRTSSASSDQQLGPDASAYIRDLLIFVQRNSVLENPSSLQGRSTGPDAERKSIREQSSD